ncbi:MAG: hypothetical protein RIS79_2645 [Verrucomicrobiota bacterium]
MNSIQETVDPAAVFACAASLREACEEVAGQQSINLSEVFNGIDQFWRVMMRVGDLFEAWACENVAFDSLTEVWPYLLMERFGAACLAWMPLESLDGFDEEDGVPVAMKMNVPLIYREGVGLPLDLMVPNPVAGSPFVLWRIQTVRWDAHEESMVPVQYGDDPHEADAGAVVVALYGVEADGRLEQVRDSKTYSEARALARKLAPGVAFPEVPVVSGGRMMNDECRMMNDE